MPVIKKTVAIHPLMDQYIRKTWALLVESGYDATYSTALNFMLLATIYEATQERGLSEKARDLIWKFVADQKTIDELNLQDHLVNISKHFSMVRTKEHKMMRTTA